MNIQVIGSFLFVTILIAIITYLKTKNDNLETSSGYFLGGRSLTGGIIAGSLLLTNLNASSFVGMSSQAYSANMSVMGWEVTSGITIVLTAVFLLPLYLKMGLTTLPTFIEKRYDKGTKYFVTWLFMLCYILNLAPTALYTGALALSTIFDIPGTFHVSATAGIWIMVWLIGIIGAVYAIFGGLKAVALSDTLNGILLVAAGILIPVFAIVALGGGNFGEGFHTFLTAHPEKLNAIGSSSDPLPFSAVFSGLLLVNMYYWGTNQSIIQRGFGAKSLKEGQKGFILAAALKILTPIIIIIPGILAFFLYGNEVEMADMIYPLLVREVLPKPLLGLLAAAMFGAILSTFNSLLNSSSTLFALDVYKPMHPDIEEKDLIRVSKIFGSIVAVLCMFIAPWIMNASGGVFAYFQTINGFFNVPIFTIVLIGFIKKDVPAIAAKIGLAFFVVVYGVLQFVVKPDLFYLHQSGILFVITCIIMLVIGKIAPQKIPFAMEKVENVDITPWKYRFTASGAVIALMVDTYVIFSPLGLAQAGGWNAVSTMLIAVIAAVCIAAGFMLDKRYSQEGV
ncbi:MAG: solute:sodium symporter family transporter [Lachnospiraceae bacterium]|nr:solute:sodium symporter family transporter [Lachnospiraceae bacterium]